MWIFAYGSLLWRPGFDFERRVAATLNGYRRAFWQASADHRGTPERPGRVLTLAPAVDARCSGLAFHVAATQRDAVLAYLDEREQGGYSRAWLGVELETGQAVTALTYIAGPDNPHWLGAAPRAALLDQICASAGPSGHNMDYVLELHGEMERLGLHDEHVSDLAAALRARCG